MSFKRNLKGAITESIVQTLLEDVGYRVVPLGIETVVREVVMLDSEEYKKLGLPNQLRTLPDFLITNKKMSKSWLLEVKYRKEWNEETKVSLKEILIKQVKLLK